MPVMPFALVQRLGVLEEDVQKWNSILLGVLGGAVFVGACKYDYFLFCVFMDGWERGKGGGRGEGEETDRGYESTIVSRS